MTLLSKGSCSLFSCLAPIVDRGLVLKAAFFEPILLSALHFRFVDFPDCIVPPKYEGLNEVRI